MIKKEDEKEKNSSTIHTTYKRSIWKFYKWTVVLAPIVLMLSHWYIFYVFSQNSDELMRYSKKNEICIAWIYTILYLYVPLIILPASYFFKWHNIFRIPFVYFIFINIERWYFDSWFCTNEMIDTHYFLIYCIISMYVIELLGLCLRNKRNLPRKGSYALSSIIQRIRVSMSKHKNAKYNNIMNTLEDKS